jgi:CheY-like chemotaxis protein
VGAKVYCPSCGIDVEPFVLTGGGREVVHCSICGLVLDTDATTSPPAPTELLKTVLIAEDTEAVRVSVAKALVDQKVTREILQARNGAEFVAQATQRLREGKPISLAILDVEMPIMNGVQAARSLRELETQLGAKRRIPILFFTTRKCDDRFKAVLQQVQPSSYVNKGSSQDPASLAARVMKVLQILLQGAGRA